MISVSEVEVSDDLRFAKIYLSFYNMNNQNNKTHFQVIKENKNIIKYKLGKQLRTKYVPKIDFILSVYEVAFVDNELHYLEQHIIRQIAHILHINNNDLIAAKIEIKNYLQ